MSENTEQPIPKRKYVKKSKMLLRSNNDYIDHTYWPKMLALSEQKHKNMMAKYGVKAVTPSDTPRELTDAERKAYRDSGIGIRHIVKPSPTMKRIPESE
jgi:tryptophan synthase alpha subunit